MSAPTESGLAAHRGSFHTHKLAWKSQPRTLALIALLSTFSYFGTGIAIRAALGRPLLSVDQVGSACTFGGVFLVMGVVWSRRRAKVTADFLAECRTHRVCASCGYSLQSLPAEPDGCTLCPECGAAWRLESARSGPNAIEKEVGQ